MTTMRNRVSQIDNIIMPDLDQWEPSSQNGITIPSFQDGYFSAPCGGETVYTVLQGLAPNGFPAYTTPDGRYRVPWLQEGLTLPGCLGYTYFVLANGRAPESQFWA
jgi:hypothetical protein